MSVHPPDEAHFKLKIMTAKDTDTVMARVMSAITLRSLARKLARYKNGATRKCFRWATQRRSRVAVAALIIWPTVFMFLVSLWVALTAMPSVDLSGMPVWLFRIPKWLVVIYFVFRIYVRWLDFRIFWLSFNRRRLRRRT